MALRTWLLLLSLALAGIWGAEASEINMCPAGLASADVGQETVQAPGLPSLGKWMLDHSGSPAHWLGEIYHGKKLREPINVVIVDAHAKSVDDAKERFVEASARAGYTIRMGHSSGYRALIAGEEHGQLPTGWDDAFSNHMFEVTNNHGRMFGPFQHGPSYVLIGAFSRRAVAARRNHLESHVEERTLNAAAPARSQLTARVMCGEDVVSGPPEAAPSQLWKAVATEGSRWRELLTDALTDAIRLGYLGCTSSSCFQQRHALSMHRAGRHRHSGTRPQ